MLKEFDVIVVGGGHAGVEASLATARMNLQTLLITTNLSRISYMSCNPSIGGLAKGNLVKEVDVLGGVMGLASDHSCLQFKRLNSKKGPAVRGSRAQCDKKLYSSFVQDYLKKQENLFSLEEEIKKLSIQNNKCEGVVRLDGSIIKSKAVILTTGTFMGAVMHVGSEQQSGGRLGDKATSGISNQLTDLGFEVTRLKTGTPPRVHRDSIDWSQVQPQKGDEHYQPMSLFSPSPPTSPDVLCHLTYTNERTHQLIQDNLKTSPLFSGIIKGVGPRYCPSIEDKVVRFKDKSSHQVFLEPEERDGESIYVQGLSTSLSKSVQEKFIQTLKGLEKAKILQYGYAVEYDFINPIQIQPTLETKSISSLFFAGQINGSSGYEEAACQGLMAGVNAAARILNLPPCILERHEAYTGVLIDDLVTKGTEEPYRMLTSRAEYRLVLREDNTIERLFEIAKTYKLLSPEKINILQTLLDKREEYKNLLNQTKWKSKDIPSHIFSVREGRDQVWTAKQILKRPEISFRQLQDLGLPVFPLEITEPVEVAIKYEGYILRQNQLIQKNKKMGSIHLKDINYKEVKGLSTEAREKLQLVQPRTLSQAERIMGVSPASIQALIVHIHSRKKSAKKTKTIST